MKLVILTLLVVCISGLSIGQIKNSLSEHKLKGRVKTITEKVYTVRDSVLKPQDKMFSKKISRFNLKGFLVAAENYNCRETLTSYDLFRYDSMRGLLLEDRSYFPDSSRKEKIVYSYDSKGNMVEEKVFEKNDTLKPILVNKYDIKSNDEPEYDSDEEKVTIDFITRHKNPDKMGNWQMELVLENKLPVSITIRELEYFADTKQKEEE